MLIKEIVDYLDERFPESTAEDFDKGKIGLIIGSKNIELKHILLSLDLNYDVALEAVNKDCNLIIVHHPYFFNPISKILYDTNMGRTLKLLFTHNISVYAMHTNLDVAIGGVNDALALTLGLKNYEVEDLNNGFVRVGDIDEMTLNELALHVKKSLNLSGVRVAGDLNKKINRVAVIGGSGGMISEIAAAKSKGAQVLVTGEIKLHIAQYAVENNFSLIEINHGAEKWVFEIIKDELENRFKAKKMAFISEINTDPLQFV